MALGDQLMLAGFVIAGIAFFATSALYFRLRHYVAKEKLHAIEDMSQLWKYGAPPKIVLNEKGLRLRQYSNVSLIILLIAASIILIVVNLGDPSGWNLLSAIIFGAFLAGMFFESRLKHHVSREKVRAVEDVSRLWILGGAVETVLNENGLRLYRYMKTAATLFFIGISVVFVGIFVCGIPDPERMVEV